ncbi:MAG: hypothetical protein K2O34_02195 [Acetatifactor sp.]|nr:hypothetical protein [Acetatifactor sp.]
MQNSNIKRHLNRSLGLALPVVLALAALYAPKGWFALRDAASMDRVHGEALSPLMVAQLDSSYERDIHDRLSACLEAIAAQDVMCSAKEVDPNNESLQENVEQANRGLVMETLIYDEFVTTSEKQGWNSVIESCTQYVLMRQSDGQILLVANDVHVDKGNGCHMELLLDGVDGTLYYLENEQTNSLSGMRERIRGYGAWNWWWILNDTYRTEDAIRLNEYYLEQDSEDMVYNAAASYDSDIIYDVNIQGIFEQDGIVVITRYDSYGDPREEIWYTKEEIATLKEEGKWIFEGGHPNIAISSEMNKETYCCLLTFGEISDSWTMEIEEDGETFRWRIRLGLPSIIQAIPEMAQRISLMEYDQIYQRDE